MPLYEYRCIKCGALFEALVSSSSSLPGSCPECGANGAEKQFSAFAVGRAAAGHSSSMPESGCGNCRSYGSCPYTDD